MKKLKQIDITVNYSVGIGDIEMPQQVFDQLSEIEEKGLTFDMNLSTKYPEAWDWLGSQISDKDAYYWEYELNELSEK